MAWYDRKENSTGALCARLSGDAFKVGTFNNFLTNLKISLTFLNFEFGRLALHC